MINCKLEGEIGVCSVDDMKSESEDNGLLVGVGRDECGIEGTSGLRVEIDGTGNKARTSGRRRYICGGSTF